jgi:hypothetical protein
MSSLEGGLQYSISRWLIHPNTIINVGRVFLCLRRIFCFLFAICCSKFSLVYYVQRHRRLALVVRPRLCAVSMLQLSLRIKQGVPANDTSYICVTTLREYDRHKLKGPIQRCLLHVLPNWYFSDASTAASMAIKRG